MVDAIASNMGTLFLRQLPVNTLIACEKFCNKNCIEAILFKDYFKKIRSPCTRSSRYSSGNKAYSPS